MLHPPCVCVCVCVIQCETRLTQRLWRKRDTDRKIFHLPGLYPEDLNGQPWNMVKWGPSSGCPIWAQGSEQFGYLPLVFPGNQQGGGSEAEQGGNEPTLQIGCQQHRWQLCHSTRTPAPASLTQQCSPIVKIRDAGVCFKHFYKAKIDLFDNKANLQSFETYTPNMIKITEILNYCLCLTNSCQLHIS